MHVSNEVAYIINAELAIANKEHYELVTPELLLYVICKNRVFAEAFEDCGGSIKELENKLESYISEYIEEGNKDTGPELSEEWGKCFLMHGR